MVYRYTLYLIPVQIKIAKGEIAVPFRQEDKKKGFNSFLWQRTKNIFLS